MDERVRCVAQPRSPRESVDSLFQRLLSLLHANPYFLIAQPYQAS